MTAAGGGFIAERDELTGAGGGMAAAEVGFAASLASWECERLCSATGWRSSRLETVGDFGASTTF